MVGVSASFHETMYVTVGVFHANVNSLNGYVPGEIVPKGTALTTTASGVNRIGYAMSFPIFPGETGKSSGSPSTTPPPSPSPKP
jgi:hypothetical protein